MADERHGETSVAKTTEKQSAKGEDQDHREQDETTSTGSKRCHVLESRKKAAKSRLVKAIN